MTKEMSITKKTYKNKGVDIEEIYINCQDPQILTKVTWTMFSTYFRLFAPGSIIMTNHWKS